MKTEATIVPAHDVVADTAGTWYIKVRIGLDGVRQWGGLRIYIPTGWSVPQFSQPAEWGYTTIDVKAENPCKTRSYIYSSRWISLEVEEGSLAPGDLVTVCYGDSREGGLGALSPRVVTPENVFEVSIDSEGYFIFTALLKSPELRVVPGDPNEIQVTIPSYYREYGTIPVFIRVEDRAGNHIPTEHRDYHLNMCFQSETIFEDSVRATKGIGKKKVNVPGTNLHRLQVVVDHAPSGLRGTSNPAVPGKTKLIWGDLHGHSNLSDGRFPPEEYFEYAREFSGLDFVCLTDHDNVGSNSNVHEHSKLMTHDTWERIKQVTNDAYEPGEFSTLVAYEYTQIESSHSGHRNVYFRSANPPIFRSWDAASNTPARLFRSLRASGERAIVIPHHARLLMSREHDPELQRLFEIYSMWGGSEHPEDTCQFLHPVKHPPGGLSFHAALQYGYRMGVVAGGDNHDSVPGFRKYTDIWRKGRMSWKSGLSAVIVSENSREALFDALYDRRCYATTGARIVLEFQVNDATMGAEIQSEKPTIMARAIGTDTIKSFELLRNAVPIRSSQGSNGEAVLDFEEKQPLSQPVNYYVRVIQTDGEKGWSSPVWVSPKSS